jgi:hypothetical protein
MTRPEIDTAIARLDDYVRGRDADGGATVDGYEEDLFARALAGDADELRFRDDLGSMVRALAGRGALDMWLTARDAAEVRASGVPATYYDLADVENPPPEIAPDAELVLARIPLPLAGVRAVDVDVLAPDGRLLKRMPDVAFDPADGAVFACCDVGLARIASASRCLIRFWGTGDAGARRVIGEIPAF